MRCVDVSTTNNRKQSVWWSGEIAERRNDCTRVRRELTRLRSRNRDSTAVINQLEAELKTRHKELKKLINVAKRARWRELCDRLGEDICGDGYSIVMKYMCGYLPCRLPTEEIRSIVEQLFPAMRGCHNIRGPAETVPCFTAEELTNAGTRVKVGKSPG